MRLNGLIKSFLFVLIAGFFIRLFLAGMLKQFTVYNDLLTFRAWGNILAENGFKNFYSGWSDYLPGYLYILGALSLIYKSLIANLIVIPVEVFYKIPSIMTDIGNTIFIYLIVKKFTSIKNAFYTAIFYYLNPVFWANSTLWGQADGFMMFFLLSSFYFLLSGRYFLSGILIAVGQVVKPIAILSIPIYLLLIFYEKKSFKILAIYLAIFAALVIFLFIPFNNKENILSFIIERHTVTSNQYPYTSLYAFNLWTLIAENWQSDQTKFYGITLHNIGSLLFICVYLLLILFTMLTLNKSHSKPLFLTYVLTIVYIAMFMLLTRMHERHLYYGLAYLTMLIPILPTSGFVVVICIYFLNLLNLYYPYSQATSTPLFLDKNTITFISTLNVVAFFYFIRLFISKYVKTKL